jgi:hypothetical protein
MVGTSKAIGFAPQWMASSTLSDAALMFKITKGLWKGVIYGNFINMDSPLVKKYLAAQKKYAPKEKYTGLFYMAGFFFAEPMVLGLQKAGKDLNPDSFVKAMESIKNYNDWLGYDLTYTSDDHQGIKSIHFSKCGEGGKRERISDWMTYKGK